MPFGIDVGDLKVLAFSGAVLALLGVWWFTNLLPVGFLVTNSLFVASAAVILLLTFWAIEEREDDERLADTTRKVIERAEDRTDGTVTAGRTAMVGLFGIAATVGTELLGLVGDLLGMGDPLAWAHLGTLSLGALALGGVINTGVRMFVGVGLLLLAAAVLAGKTPWVE